MVISTSITGGTTILLTILGMRYHYNIYNHMLSFVGSFLIVFGFNMLLANNQLYLTKNFIYNIVGITAFSKQIFDGKIEEDEQNDDAISESSEFNVLIPVRLLVIQIVIMAFSICYKNKKVKKQLKI